MGILQQMNGIIVVGGGSDFHSFKNHCFKTDGVPFHTGRARRSWPNFDLSYVLQMPL